MAIRIVDVTDTETFGLLPPCADPGFDHRTCDYWEDADRGSKAARLAWLEAAPPPATARPGPADNPFAPPRDEPAFNPFAPTDRSSRAAFNPFALNVAVAALAAIDLLVLAGVPSASHCLRRPRVEHA